MTRTLPSTSMGPVSPTYPPTTGSSSSSEDLQSIQGTTPKTATTSGVQSLAQPGMAAPALAQAADKPLTLLEPRTGGHTGSPLTKKYIQDALNDIRKQSGTMACQVGVILTVLTKANYLAPNPAAKTQTLVHPSARGAVHELVEKNPAHLSETARDFAVELLDKGMRMKHPNIDEVFKGKGARNTKSRNATNAKSKNAENTKNEGVKDAFKTWFYAFSATVNLLASRIHDKAPLDLRQQQALLKAELLRGQLQATYQPDKAEAFGRSLSPLVAQGYGRGVRTGLWMAVQDMHEKTLAAGLKGPGQKGPKLKDFDVFPVNRKFSYLGNEPLIEKDIPKTLTAGKCIYIESLGVQLVPKSLYADKAKGRGEVDAHLGGLGLRNSPSECADILSKAMVDRINVNDPNGAIELLKASLPASRAGQMLAALRELELAPNTLIASENTDPLTQSSKSQIEKLRQTFEMCASRASASGMPFYASQNFQVIKTLLGNFDNLSVSLMPSATCGALTDALQRAALALDEAHADLIAARNAPPAALPDGGGPAVEDAAGDELSIRQAMNMEKFYQAMQDVHHVVRFLVTWTRGAPTLDDSIRAMLPRSLHEHTKVASAPHALAMLDQIFKALPSAQSAHTIYLKGAYYETASVLGLPDSLPPVATVDDDSLRTADVIVMEPHPNNAALQRIEPHDPVALISNVMSDDRTKPLTLVMDVTLNHLRDDDIQRTLGAAQPYIDKGVLNLVLLQSGTKFFQNGMDLVSIGTAVVINDKKSNWTHFNEALTKSEQHVPDDDKGYIALLLSAPNAEASRAYLHKVRANTRELRAYLQEEIPLGHGNANAFEICANTDQDTVYIAFKPTEAYLTRINEETAKKDNKSTPELDYKRRSELNIGVYKAEVLRAFGDLTVADRSSFGFNITNFGECGETVRITLGIEETSLLKTYASRLLTLGRELYVRPAPAINI
ncbi:MAG: hypothetical protein WC284_10320 [Candidimonas sp.]